MSGNVHSIKRTDEYKRIVYAEVVVPNVLNSFNDLHTPESVFEMMQLYMEKGFDLDREHDRVILGKAKVKVVESFLARPGDPDFIEGSWVLGVHIIDDDLWAAVLAGEINGFSHDTFVEMTEIEITDTGVRVITGVTEPDLIDGHTHTYTVLVNVSNSVISGGTGETDGHSHTITRAPLTGKTDGHSHRFQVVEDSTGASQ